MANYGTIFVLFLVAGGIALLLWTLASVLGPRSPNPRKERPFECGNPPFGPVVKRVSVKFYVVALLFIAFDIETVFLYPWAVIFSELGWIGFWTMVTFVGILGFGLVYVWKKGALDWA